MKTAPFRCQEEGWGEFDIQIILHTIGKGGDHTVSHDLNFQQERYEAVHKIVSFLSFPNSFSSSSGQRSDEKRHEQTFKNPKPELMALLRESGPVPGGDENGVSKAGGKGDGAAKKKSRGGNKVRCVLFPVALLVL